MGSCYYSTLPPNGNLTGAKPTLPVSLQDRNCGSRALAETKVVTVALADRPFNGKLRSASFLKSADGATAAGPADGALQLLNAWKLVSRKIAWRVPRQIRSWHPIEPALPFMC